MYIVIWNETYILGTIIFFLKGDYNGDKGSTRYKCANNSNILTGQSEPNATNALESKSDLNKYDSLSALSLPSFLPATSASSNKWSGCWRIVTRNYYKSCQRHCLMFILFDPYQQVHKMLLLY
jgi:hypothetical protein